jgi:hypothetical protein
LGHAVDGTDYTAQVVMLQEFEDDKCMFQQGHVHISQLWNHTDVLPAGLLLLLPHVCLASTI